MASGTWVVTGANSGIGENVSHPPSRLPPRPGHHQGCAGTRQAGGGGGQGGECLGRNCQQPSCSSCVRSQRQLPGLKFGRSGVFGRLKNCGVGWLDRRSTLALWMCLLTMQALVEPGWFFCQELTTSVDQN